MTKFKKPKLTLIDIEEICKLNLQVDEDLLKKSQKQLKKLKGFGSPKRTHYNLVFPFTRSVSRSE